ncbi:MAG: hypothetical protein OXF06_03485 [Bacteroidetes bacterium]|nr:hypothetical protein [Bacteroidota bacterium]MCY4223879.1 hypothetical protein [Bacteroidota bacterium]
MFVLRAILLALFSELDAGFENSNFIDHMDTDIGVYDVNVILSNTAHFSKKRAHQDPSMVLLPPIQ